MPGESFFRKQKENGHGDQQGSGIPEAEPSSCLEGLFHSSAGRGALFDCQYLCKVYIVSGPIFLNKQHRKLGKNKVVVPDAFFKVILRTGKNPQAIGFICRNQRATGLQKKDFVNSVDEVERITGYDFFSKLPDNIEKKIEAKADINQW